MKDQLTGAIQMAIAQYHKQIDKDKCLSFQVIPINDKFKVIFEWIAMVDKNDREQLGGDWFTVTIPIDYDNLADQVELILDRVDEVEIVYLNDYERGLR